MLHATTQQLIQKLYELTDVGALAWKQGPGDASRLETEGYVIEVEAAPATLRLLREDGHELERADQSDLDATPWPSGEGAFATRVSQMANRAYRVSRGSERAITQIMSSLSAPPKYPLFVASPSAPKFGAIKSFAKPTPPAPVATSTAPPSEPPKPSPRPAPDLLIQGISARSVQGVESTPPIDFQRVLAPRPAERKPERAPVGADIYKPWR